MARLVILDAADLPIMRQWQAVSRQERMAAPADIVFKEFLVKRGDAHLPLLDKLYPAEGMAPEG